MREQELQDAVDLRLISEKCLEYLDHQNDTTQLLVGATMLMVKEEMPDTPVTLESFRTYGNEGDWGLHKFNFRIPGIKRYSEIEYKKIRELLMDIMVDDGQPTVYDLEVIGEDNILVMVLWEG